MNFKTPRRALLALVLCCAWLPGAAAQSVADALAGRLAQHDQARQVQIAIDELRGKRQSLALDLDAQRLVDELANTRATLERARARNAELRASITAQRDAQAGLVPLLEHMLDLLSDSLDLDLPINVPPRRQAIARARAKLGDASLRAADRYDAVMALYRDHLRAAYTMDTQRDQRAIGGATRLVTLLRVGRIALYALSDDGTQCHVFQLGPRSWKALMSGQCQRLHAARDRWTLEDIDGLPLSVMTP